jgi:hypothetical protein
MDLRPNDLVAALIIQDRLDQASRHRLIASSTRSRRPVARSIWARLADRYRASRQGRLHVPTPCPS